MPSTVKSLDGLKQGSQTQIYRMATFQRKMIHGPQLIRKDLLWAAIYKLDHKNELKLILSAFEFSFGRPCIWHPLAKTIVKVVPVKI
jgi:hypothetical protein